MMDYQPNYSGQKVLITGGLGFIGSNLAIELSRLGANVTVIDALTEDDGGNRTNLSGHDEVETIIGDIGNDDLVRPLVKQADLIFNLSGRVSHIDSVRDPVSDLYANTVSQLRLLESARAVKPEVRIVYASTRQIYGRADTTVVNEDSPIRPIDPNGISKFAADAYHRMFARDFGMRTVVLRLTNTYGPRQLLRHNRQGFIPWFIRLAMEGKELSIFGDGRQTRDATFVDDVVDAFVRVGALPDLNGQVFNLGSNFVHSVREIAETAISVAGAGRLRLVPFPDEKRRIDIGSIACDFSRFTAATGWSPTIDLRPGIERTVEYYRERIDDYL